MLGDWGFHKAAGDAPNFKLSRRGEWNERMKVETVLFMLTVVCNMQHMRHRVWDYFETELAYLLAAFNFLVQWNGLEPDEKGRVRLSIAQFTRYSSTSTIGYIYIERHLAECLFGNAHLAEMNSRQNLTIGIVRIGPFFRLPGVGSPKL